MRIALFHNWSWLGGAIAQALLESKEDHLWLIGGNCPPAQRDPELLDHAQRAGVESYVPRDVESDHFLKRLETFAPELIVVGTFAKKLPPSVLAVPTLAAINVHSSLLPAYRGALPEFWVIRNGERESGLTIHHMNERFDAGNVLAQEAFALTPEDTLLSLSMRLAYVGPKLLAGVLDRYRSGERPVGDAQDESKICGAPLVRDEHLEVVWSQSADSIDRLVRAAFPVFEAHTRFRGERLVLKSVRPSYSGREDLTPGALLVDAHTKRLLVGTGRGTLVIEGIEIQGDSSTSGMRFAERFELKPGDMLGQ